MFVLQDIKFHFIYDELNLYYHCVKSVHIRSYSGPYFPAFGLNTERYEVSLRIQSKCRKIRTRITPNTDTFHAAHNVANLQNIITSVATQ